MTDLMCPKTRFPDGTHCGEYGWHASDCPSHNRPSGGPALDVWDNLPPHLQQALRDALEGLSEAFEDVAHPISPHLQRMWDVEEEIEAYILAREQGVSASRE